MMPMSNPLMTEIGLRFFEREDVDTEGLGSILCHIWS